MASKFLYSQSDYNNDFQSYIPRFPRIFEQLIDEIDM